MCRIFDQLKFESEVSRFVYDCISVHKFIYAFVYKNFFLSVFSAILQASVWGVASKFPSKYIAAATSGQALGGIFAALVSIASLAVSASSTTSALIYFIIAVVTVLTGLIFYKILSLTVSKKNCYFVFSFYF